MKLVFFHYSMQSGGAERMIALLSNYAIRKGHAVTIVTMDDRQSFYELDPDIGHIRLGIAGTSKNAWNGLNRNIRSIRVIRTAYKQICPDIVIGFGSNFILLSYLARGNLKYKLVGSERTNPYMVQAGFWNKSKKWISKLCDGYIFQSEGAQKYYPISTQSRSIVLPNGINSNDFSVFDRPWSERRDICAVGRMDKDKCFDDLLAAFSSVYKQHSGIHLDIYGDGPLRSELEQQSAALSLQKAVIFHGKSNRIYEEYSKHKLFVMTSRREGMPNVLLEAMASGCACISTNCDFGPSELIRDGENGFLVPVHGREAMAEQICRLLGDDGLCQKYSAAAKAVRQTNDISAIGESFLKYIESIKKQRKDPKEQ